jgi:hypothetical protein
VYAPAYFSFNAAYKGVTGRPYHLDFTGTQNAFLKTTALLSMERCQRVAGYLGTKLIVKHNSYWP